MSTARGWLLLDERDYCVRVKVNVVLAVIKPPVVLFAVAVSVPMTVMV